MLYSPKTYARTLIKNLPKKDVAPLNTLITELSLFDAVARQSRLHWSLTERLTPFSQKQPLLAKVLPALQISREAQAIIVILTKNKQITVLPQVIRILKDFRLKEFGMEEGEVVACVPLSTTEKARAKKILEKISGHQILLTETVDHTIMGGVVVKCGDTRFDGSLLRKIIILRALLAV